MLDEEKRKLKKIRISSESSERTHPIERRADKVDGWFKLGTWKTRAGKKKLVCSGTLEGSPGELDNANIVITRHQRPSDFLDLDF